MKCVFIFYLFLNEYFEFYQFMFSWNTNHFSSKIALLTSHTTAKLNMARVHSVPQILHYFLYFSFVLCCFTSFVSANRELDEDNWKEILDGEWMVEL